MYSIKNYANRCRNWVIYARVYQLWTKAIRRNRPLFFLQIYCHLKQVEWVCYSYSFSCIMWQYLRGWRSVKHKKYSPDLSNTKQSQLPLVTYIPSRE